MTIRQRAVHFSQNFTDYIDPVGAWERTRAHATHDAVQRRKDGNFIGRALTEQEAYQNNVDYFRKGVDNMQNLFAAHKAKREGQKQDII